MGHNQAGDPTPSQITIHRGLGFRVQCAGGFVQDEKGGVIGETSGDFKSLALATAEIGTCFIHPSFVSPMTTHDSSWMQASRAADKMDASNGGGIPEGQIFSDGAVEKKNVLVDHGDGMGEDLSGNGGYGETIKQNLTVQGS